ncbi:hypothetical protein [Caballeronia sp. J97]|uniref:hypothetical protein n=1 Tax=Caballeronia sp. J97 TaxID=2805429 RepID=UPI002AAF61E8|nr:hypothetical protein [Caballeronia sp. J97]
MSKNKLLIAITAGLFSATAVTGAFAQTSPGDSAGATTDNSAAMTTPKKHKTRKHSSHATAAKKTPAAETGSNAATSGQSK